jgi:hypothetical protein
MKILLRVVVGFLLTLALLVGAITLSLFVDAARPKHRVGFQMVTVRNPQGKPLHVAIWYPTDSQPGFRLVGFVPQMLATNGTAAGRDLCRTG